MFIPVRRDLPKTLIHTRSHTISKSHRDCSNSLAVPASYLAKNTQKVNTYAEKAEKGHVLNIHYSLSQLISNLSQFAILGYRLLHVFITHRNRCP